MILQQKLEELVNYWHEYGLGSRQSIEKSAEDLLLWRKNEAIPGLWDDPKLLMTATLDDGLGYGLEIIHLYARLAGLEIESLGLLKSPDVIIEACRIRCPDFLGLTVLQFDSEDALNRICESIPESIKVIAGGPVFRGDNAIKMVSGVDCAAADLIDYVSYLIEQAALKFT